LELFSASGASEHAQVRIARRWISAEILKRAIRLNHCQHAPFQIRHEAICEFRQIRHAPELTSPPKSQSEQT
jgi:hypothetical protein